MIYLEWLLFLCWSMLFPQRLTRERSANSHYPYMILPKRSLYRMLSYNCIYYIVSEKKSHKNRSTVVNSFNNCSENFVFYWSFSTGNLTNRNSKVLFTVSFIFVDVNFFVDVYCCPTTRSYKIQLWFCFLDFKNIL